jgi:hypothetical protein
VRGASGNRRPYRDKRLLNRHGERCKEFLLAKKPTKSEISCRIAAQNDGAKEFFNKLLIKT